MEISDQNSGKQTLTYASAMLATLLWASAFPATRYVLQFYSPTALMVIRFLVASATLILAGVIKKISLPKIKDIPMFIASGISGVFLYSYLFNTGLVTVSAGVSSFIISSAPIFTLIFTRVFLKELIKPICWIGVFISFCGLAAVTLTQASEFSFNIGVFLILCAAISSGVYSTVVRVLTKKYTALEVTTYTIITGTIGMLIFLPAAIREIPDSDFTANIIIIFLGIFPAAIAYLAWSYALAKALKAANVTVFSYLIPFVSVLIAYLWLGETLSIYALLGGLVIIIGMILTNAFGKDRRK